MNEQLLSIHEKDLRTRLLPLLNGRVFHVTTLAAYRSILTDGVIKTNKSGQFKFSWGCPSYFQKRDCVSLFDLRSVTAKELDDALSKCYFLNSPYTANKPVYLFLKQSCFDRLLPWTRWKEEAAYREMVIPYVETGFPGNIPIDHIDGVLRVDVDVTGPDGWPLGINNSVSEGIQIANERIDQDRKRIAYHEAGHAALIAHFKQPIDKISIVSGETLEGVCQGRPLKKFPRLDKIFDPDKLNKAVKVYEKAILIYLAGPEAEKLLTGLYDIKGAVGDYEKASKLAIRLGCENFYEYLVRLNYLLNSDPINLWIHAIAKALLDKKTLTGREIKEVIVQSTEEEL